jgi:hypothetical protein
VTVQRVSVAQRRARLAVRHHLATTASAASVEDAVRGLVVFHATDPATVHLSARARVESCKQADVEHALYEARTLIRMLGMRRTMFVVPRELVAAVDAGSAQAIAARERRSFTRMLEQAGIASDGEAWLRRISTDVLAALEARGEAYTTELSADVPAMREQIHFGAGRKWAGSFSVGTRVLLILGAEGRIVRGRPRGSWVSSQFSWTPMHRWLPDAPAAPAMTTAQAQAQLARRWLARFGPGTIEDLKWWMGWTLAETRRALAAVAPVEVELEHGGTGLVLPDDLEPVPTPQPWVSLLPTLDATIMGWKQRDWYLGERGMELFDSAGNAGPSIWCDGRIVGGWAIRDGGEVVFRLFEDIGSEASEAVAEEAARTSHWLSAVRVIPRFRTPLERELIS